MSYSIIIPVCNEEKSVEPLCISLKEVLGGLGGSYELILINDGSKDGTFQALESVRRKFQPTRFVIVDLIEHCGQSGALQAGFDLASGDILITMDGDLQYDPRDIPRLLDKLKQGYDVVCGRRVHRSDPWMRRLSATVANGIRRLLLGERVHDVGCSFRVYRKQALENVGLSEGMHRFLTAILLRSGCQLGELEVRHYPRRFGRSAYNLRNRLGIGLYGLFRILFTDMGTLMRQRSHYEIRQVIGR